MVSTFSDNYGKHQSPTLGLFPEKEGSRPAGGALV